MSIYVESCHGLKNVPQPLWTKDTSKPCHFINASFSNRFFSVDFRVVIEEGENDIEDVD